MGHYHAPLLAEAPAYGPEPHPAPAAPAAPAARVRGGDDVPTPKTLDDVYRMLCSIRAILSTIGITIIIMLGLAIGVA